MKMASTAADAAVARAEDQPEFAQPADLVDEGAKAGSKQERRDTPGARPHANE